MNDIDWASCPDATHFDPVDKNFLRELDSALLLFNNNLGWTVPSYTQYGVTIEECKRPLLKHPEWTGEDLPPVGTVCDWAHHQAPPARNSDWHVGDIRYISDCTVIIGGERCEHVHHPRNCSFRPVRTAEEIAAEGREQRLVQMSHSYQDATGRAPSSYVQEAFRALDQEGYRKQVQP